MGEPSEQVGNYGSDWLCVKCGHLCSAGLRECPVCGWPMQDRGTRRGLGWQVLAGVAVLVVSVSAFTYRQAQTEALFGHYSRGVRAFESANYEVAVAELEQADGYGGSRELLLKARQRLETVVSSYSKGTQAMVQGRWWEAAYWLRQAADLSPNYRDATELLRRAREKVGYLVIQKPGRPVSPLYFGHSDGGDLRQIPAPPGTFYPVALSADGRTLLTIQFNRDGTTYSLMDTATGSTRWLISLQVPAAARLAPDAGAVAVFPYRMGPEVRELSPLNLLVPGGGTVRLAEGWQQARADFSPSGRQVAFSVSYKGSAELFLYDLDGGDLAKVAELSEVVESLSFGLDGRHLVVTTFDGQAYALAVVSLRGEVREVVRSPRYLGGILGPDGKHLLYREGTLGESIFTMRDLSSGEEYPMFSCCGSAYQMPYYTADGTRILFLSGQDADVPNVYSVRPDGTERLLVAEGVIRFVAAPKPLPSAHP